MNSEWVEAIGVWAGATGTFIAVLYALYHDRHRPHLSMQFNQHSSGNVSYFSSKDTEGTDELWIKLGIRNDTSLNAEDVQLRLVSIKDTQAEGSLREFSSWWFKVSGLNSIGISIPPCYVQYFDLCYLSANAGRERGPLLCLPIVRPQMLDWPLEKEELENSENRTLGLGGPYELVLAVSGTNTNANYYRITILSQAAELLKGHGGGGLQSSLTIAGIERLKLPVSSKSRY